MKLSSLLRWASGLGLACSLAFGAADNAIPLPRVCGVELKSPRVHWETLEDVEGGLEQDNFNVVQRASDIFSWQDFIALNWPASEAAHERGLPAKNKPFDAPGPRVWETWKEPGELYLPNGEEPLPWDSEPKPPGAPFASAPKAKILFRHSKIDRVLSDDMEPTVSDGVLPKSLKDQRGETVRFEIRLNRVLFDYVVKNKLYDAQTQAQRTSIQAPVGSILVKAAWRVLGKDDTDFHSTEAWIPDESKPGKNAYRLAKVGLVGFHIMHKTTSAPQWIWSTFEQVRNVNGKDASFHDDRCSHCAENVQTPDGVPNQVTRVIPIPNTDPDCDAKHEAVDNLAALNKAVQAGLGRSVFKHYEQIGTQWPVRGSTGKGNPTTVFSVLPALLGNTTLETFIQNTSSCMGCHAMARSANASAFVGSDFTFTFSNAQPKQTNPGLLHPPVAPGGPKDLVSWVSILRGYQIATKTYETLPKNVPTAKLHCQSCHLNAGGNPTASWWAGMMVKYNYPETTKLIGRINQCFERSMNGVALCDNNERNNPEMNALITYMQWLDRQATSRHLPMPPTAFPAITKGLTGDSKRGGRIFLQKCAFCHGAEGEGRYQSGSYYRPALWGAQSYNASAGMFKTASSDPPAFIKANMPFGSGGELTDQEAWDLAAFINDTSIHPRPGS